MKNNPCSMPSRRRHRALSLAAAVAAVLASHESEAAGISWDPVSTITGDSDVSTIGALDRAHLFGGTNATVNGVSFNPFNGSGDTATIGAQYGSFGGGGAPFDNLSANYRTLLTNGYYGDGNPQTLSLNLETAMEPAKYAKREGFTEMCALTLRVNA